jgi:hypothetical protein
MPAHLAQQLPLLVLPSAPATAMLHACSTAWDAHLTWLYENLGYNMVSIHS